MPQVADSDRPDLTRLPKSVIPKRYELKLDVYPKEKEYNGLVNIRLYFVSKSTSIIWLHSVRLQIIEASIRFSQFALPIEASEIINHTAYDCIGIRFATPVDEGSRAWLSIKFSGKLSDHLEGFYSAPYVDRNGETQDGAVTMFAATEARTCFPCFDEPDFKAIFSLEVTVDEHLMVLSNMPVMNSAVKVTDGGRRRRTDTFEWTKEMSTYLVCVIVGHYEFLEVKAAGRTTVRAYTPWGQREKGRFALEVARKSLEFFNDYFGNRYPLPKLDLVAVSRLSVGAMECWGIIIIRETGMITEEEEANPLSLQKIATLIAHEVSHQWFGNLVTMKWWDGLYLNEGFATLMQYICIDHIFPEYQVFDRFCTDTVIPALGLDALHHSHPVEMPLERTTEISQAFDKITYCKGASVMYMLHDFIGPKAFKTAIQEYMDAYAYENATTEDLWQHLGRSCKEDVASVMSAWIRERGFPIVKAKLIQRDGIHVLQLVQERFSNVAHGDKFLLWTIPIKLIYVDTDGKSRQLSALFDRQSMEMELPGFDLQDPKCWVKLNPKLVGFYRVYYGERLFEALMKNFHSRHLKAIDRVGLFDDQVAMVLAEDGSTVRILKIVELFKEGEEDNAVVWKSVCGILHQIRTLTWPTEELADLFDQFCLDTLTPIMSRVGRMPQSRETSNSTALRATIFAMLASLGDEATIGAAKELFRNHVDNVNPIPKSLREAVFRAVMVTATTQTFQQMLMLYRNSELAEERLAILQSLGCARDQDVLQLALSFALSSDVHAQEAIVVIIGCAMNRFGYKFAWNFFATNLEKILDRYLGTLFLLPRMVKSVTESFCDQQGYQQVADFLATNRTKFKGSETSVEQAEEHLRLNVYWRDKDASSIRHFLNSYFNS